MKRAIVKALFIGLFLVLALGATSCLLRTQPVGRSNAHMRGDDDHGRRRGPERRQRRDDDHDDHDDDDDHDDHDD